MKRILSAAAVAAVLAIGSSAVLAQTVPTHPTTGPIPTPDSGNGGLIFWAYDATRNVSLVDYLGLSFNDVLPTGTDMNTPGKVLDFGTIGSFASTFAASQNSNVFWGVAATDYLGGVTSTRILSTGPVGSTDLFMNSAGLTAAAGKINDFVLSVNAACTTNPCTANDPNQGQYAGTSLWADNFGGGLGWQATTNPGSSLGFYLVNAAAGPRPTGAVVTPFQASTGAYGQWLLDLTGKLTYSVEAGNDPSPVPVPAAVWLLLSGISGLVTISRRRKTA